MQEINIKLWRHTEEKDWSAEVYGRLHKHISTKTVDELVEYVLVATQQALLKSEAPPGESAMAGDLPLRKRPRRSVARTGSSGIHIAALVS
jgi:3-oxoacyl-(acyl-carrier-protein) synthase